MGKPVKEWPKSERPRERLLSQGAGALSDAELLAVILRNGADGTTFELPPREAVAKFLADFRSWCLTDEATKLARQVPAAALPA